MRHDGCNVTRRRFGMNWLNELYLMLHRESAEIALIQLPGPREAVPFLLAGTCVSRANNFTSVLESTWSKQDFALK
jgi:hypothetical protein